MILLGMKLVSIERASNSYEHLFAETRDKIKSISFEVTSIEQLVNEQKKEDV
jgi:hypothetical protein